MQSNHLKKYYLPAIIISLTLTACSNKLEYSEDFDDGHDGMADAEEITMNKSPATHHSEIKDEHSSEISLDWTGYYYGVSTSNTHIWLELNKFDEKILYQIIENHQKQPSKPSIKQGEATKLPSKGLTLQLDDKQLVVGEGYAELTGNNSQKLKLDKMDAFSGNGVQLLTNYNDVVVSEDPQLAKFKGLINFEHIEQGGHKSLSANIVIDCKQQQYNLNSVNYYSSTYAMGNLIESANKNENWLPFSNEDDIMAQAAKAFCH